MAEAGAQDGRRTKVLWLTKGLGPGGAERLLLSFAQHADHERFEFHAAYLLPWKDHLVTDLESAGVTTHCLDAQHLWDPRWLWRLRKLIGEEHFDVIHDHSPLVAAQARLLVRTVARGRRPTTITTEHNMWGSHQRLTRWLNAATISLDDHIFAVSDQVRDSMSPRIRDRVEVLIHGVDVEAIAARRSERAEARAERGLTENDFVVVTVANLRANKDYPTMLRAARQLVDDGENITFLAVGQGPLETELHALRDDLDLGDRFRFLGYQSDPIRVLAAGDVFCLSSVFEGLPIALLEALAVGLPVVATDVGGIPGAITHGVEGHLVPPSSPAELSAAIGSFVRSSTRRTAPDAASVRSHDFAVSTSVDRQQLIYEANDPHRSRVAFILPSLETGGLQIATSRLADAMAKTHGWDVSVVALRRRGATQDHGIEASERYSEHLRERTTVLGVAGRADRSPRALASATRRLARTLRSLSPDVVVSATFECDVVARLATRATRPSPVTVTYLVNATYEPSVAAALGRARRIAQPTRLADRVTGRLFTDHYVAISMGVRDSAVKHLRISPERITVIPRGGFPVHTPASRNATSRTLQLVGGGRLVTQKGFAALIDGVVRAQREGVEVELTIFGDGPLGSELQQRAGQGTPGTIRLPGPVHDFRERLHSFVAFCLPSLWEGFGNVLLEAMHAGLPIIASDIPVAREVTDDQAYCYVPAGSGDGWAAAIARASADPSGLERSAQRTTELARRRYTIDQEAAALDEQLRLLIDA